MLWTLRNFKFLHPKHEYWHQNLILVSVFSDYLFFVFSNLDLVLVALFLRLPVLVWYKH